LADGQTDEEINTFEREATLVADALVRLVSLDVVLHSRGEEQ
jgi:hypothetical protein